MPRIVRAQAVHPAQFARQSGQERRSPHAGVVCHRRGAGAAASARRLRGHAHAARRSERARRLPGCRTQRRRSARSAGGPHVDHRPAGQPDDGIPARRRPHRGPRRHRQAAQELTHRLIKELMLMPKIEKRYRKLVFLVWFLTLDLIMFGAFVRLTDSGLGCPDWPGCYGKLSPVGASDHIRDALATMPHGPVSFGKAWIEMAHRYVGSLLGLMIIGIAWMAWRWRRELGHTATLAIVTLIAVCVQGAFGAWTVTHKLM